MIYIKPPTEYFFEPREAEVNQPEEPAKLFEKRAKGMELWCHVCEGLTTYEELSVQLQWGNYRACPHCGLFATVQDIS